MKRKPMPSDFALWATLPMAQTSKIEGRIALILDSSRRRTLPRRAVWLAAAVGTAALVPLAMLRPDAKAQAAPVKADTVQLLGVQDIDIHHTDHRWWDASGRILANEVNARVPSRATTDMFRSSNDRNLRFAVRLPAFTEAGDVTFVSSGSFFPKAVMSPSGSRGTAWSLYTAFSGSTKTTTLLVGAAAGPWTETVDCPKASDEVRLSRPTGDVVFTLVPNPRGQSAAQAAPGDALLMVSDHFHRPSPLPVDEMAVLISSYASRTRSGDAVQKLLHDGEDYERTVYGLDKSGQIIAKLAGTSDPSLEEEENDRFKMEQLLSIPKPLLKRIASFRLVARPYQWTEFKDVALQPVQ